MQIQNSTILSHHDTHISDISKILSNGNLQMFCVCTMIYQIAQSLILKSIFCCNLVFYKSSSLTEVLTKTILVNWTLPKLKATSQWGESYSVTELCQISEELRFWFLKKFDTQDFSHCNILTLFDTVGDEPARFFFPNLFWNFPYLAHSAQKQVIGLRNSLAQLCSKGFLLQVTCDWLMYFSCKDCAWEARSSSSSTSKREKRKSNLFKLTPLQSSAKVSVSCLGNRNYPNPLMQLSSICRDTNISKDAPLDLFFHTFCEEK